MPPFVHVYCFADEPPRLCIAADEPVSVTYADTGKKVPIPTTGGIALLRDTDPIDAQSLQRFLEREILPWYARRRSELVEMAQITPPVGFNLFVLQAFSGRDILFIARASVPFFLVLIAGVVMLMVFPDIATYLPQRMLSR